jgi:hypothetical protein
MKYLVLASLLFVIFCTNNPELKEDVQKQEMRLSASGVEQERIKRILFRAGMNYGR